MSTSLSSVITSMTVDSMDKKHRNNDATKQSYVSIVRCTPRPTRKFLSQITVHEPWLAIM